MFDIGLSLYLYVCVRVFFWILFCSSFPLSFVVRIETLCIKINMIQKKLNRRRKKTVPFDSMFRSLNFVKQLTVFPPFIRNGITFIAGLDFSVCGSALH